MSVVPNANQNIPDILFWDLIPNSKISYYPPKTILNATYNSIPKYITYRSQMLLNFPYLSNSIILWDIATMESENHINIYTKKNGLDMSKPVNQIPHNWKYGFSTKNISDPEISIIQTFYSLYYEATDLVIDQLFSLDPRHAIEIGKWKVYFKSSIAKITLTDVWKYIYRDVVSTRDRNDELYKLDSTIKVLGIYNPIPEDLNGRDYVFYINKHLGMMLNYIASRLVVYVAQTYEIYKTYNNSIIHEIKESHSFDAVRDQYNGIGGIKLDALDKIEYLRYRRRNAYTYIRYDIQSLSPSLINLQVVYRITQQYLEVITSLTNKEAYAQSMIEAGSDIPKLARELARLEQVDFYASRIWDELLFTNAIKYAVFPYYKNIEFFYKNIHKFSNDYISSYSSRPIVSILINRIRLLNDRIAKLSSDSYIDSHLSELLTYVPIDIKRKPNSSDEYSLDSISNYDEFRDLYFILPYIYTYLPTLYEVCYINTQITNSMRYMVRAEKPSFTYEGMKAELAWDPLNADHVFLYNCQMMRMYNIVGVVLRPPMFEFQFKLDRVDTGAVTDDRETMPNILYDANMGNEMDYIFHRTDVDALIDSSGLDPDKYRNESKLTLIRLAAVVMIEKIEEYNYLIHDLRMYKLKRRTIMYTKTKYQKLFSSSEIKQELDDLSNKVVANSSSNIRGKKIQTINKPRIGIKSYFKRGIKRVHEVTNK